MLGGLGLAWRRRVDLLFIGSTTILCARYMLFVERIPNYLRVLHWFAAWFH
jgi:hypothetical protein